ncbi:MAG: hypothetical protein V4501_00030 [Pseudomonadota bacterium]
MLRNIPLPQLQPNMTIEELEATVRHAQGRYRDYIEHSLDNHIFNDWLAYQPLLIYIRVLVEGSKSLEDLKLWKKIIVKVAEFNSIKGFIYSNHLAGEWGEFLEAYKEILALRRQLVQHFPQEEYRFIYGELVQYQQHLVNPDAQPYAAYLNSIRSSISTELAKTELTWGDFQTALGNVQNLHNKTRTLEDLKFWVIVFKKAVEFNTAKNLTYTSWLKEKWEVLLDAHSTMLHDQRKLLIEFPLDKVCRANYAATKEYQKVLYPEVKQQEAKQQEAKQPEVNQKKGSSALLSWFRNIKAPVPKPRAPVQNGQRLQ